ncbi:MAG: LPS-assembly protein LptD [Nitrospiraceae bacterium]|nr:MAG: LPS-assembly protein LptD [Nitrospiraceae bacterium]
MKSKENAANSIRHMNLKSLCACMLFTVCCLLSAVYCFAEEPPAFITSDSLKYEKSTSIYTAKGSVLVEQGEAIMMADEMKYDEKTSNVFPEGNVVYDTPDMVLKAEKAEFNLNTKKGTFYNAEIFSKKEKFRVSGAEIEKRGEKEYFIKKALVTTCENPSPEWCIKGRTADIIIGDRFRARDATFHVKDFPILYTPYLLGPALTERKTGLLTPVFGYSQSKGFYYRQPFFWAIDEDKDATFIVDWYSRAGLGEGAEYRYVTPGNVEGKHWLYHFHDKKAGSDFYELKSIHSKRSKEGLSGYWNINLLNEKNFYKEFSLRRDERVNRFLESTAELTLPSDGSRLYLMSQYIIDLKEGSRHSAVAQRLPEFGYVVNPARVGPVIFSMTSSASNFEREKGVSGQRLDIYPKISHSFGDKIILSQNLGLRETMYSLHRNEAEGFKSSVHRDIFDYNITASGRLVKKHSENFTHGIEPSLGYTFIPWVKKDRTNVPLFDSTELYTKQSTIGMSLTNRLLDKKGEFLTVSVSESYNTYERDVPLSPLSVSAFIPRPVPINADASYNHYNDRIETLNSSVTIPIKKFSFFFGERYNQPNKTMFYDIGAGYAHSKNLSAEVKLWYDAKGGGMRDSSFIMKYLQQCWGMTITVNRKPPDEVNSKPSELRVFVAFDLLGLGSYSARK